MSRSPEAVVQNQQGECPGLPSEVELFPFQVGGHKHGKGRLALGILRHKNGDVLKPLFEGDSRSEVELSFYETAFNQDHSDPILQELRKFLPGFHGTQIIELPDKSVKYLCLEDVCRPFRKPSVLDIKIGSRTYEINATKEKILEQQQKFLHGATLGIRIIGMKVYDERTNGYFVPEKSYLRSLSSSTLLSALQQYFTNDNFINTLLLCGFLHKLHQIDQWFAKQRKFMFTASSVLFIYEGNLTLWTEWIQQQRHLHQRGDAGDNPSVVQINGIVNPPAEICSLCGVRKNICDEALIDCSLFKVTMIDFAHITLDSEKDSNYINGLHALIGYFINLLQDQLEEH